MITRKNEQKISIREYMRGGKKHVKLAALSKSSRPRMHVCSAF